VRLLACSLSSQVPAYRRVQAPIAVLQPQRAASARADLSTGGDATVPALAKIEVQEAACVEPSSLHWLGLRPDS